MYPSSFEYTRTDSVEQAIELLGEYGEDARLLAGGASLIPLMKLRLANPTHLIDIGRLSDLVGVRREDGSFVVGALTRHADLERHAELPAALPIVHDAASHIGDTQVRNMGTIGGSLAECDPAGDWAPVLLALDGAVRVRGSGGERTIAATDLFLDAYTTALRPDEVLTEVVLPIALSGVSTGDPLPPPTLSQRERENDISQGERGFGAAHVKIERRAGDFAIANCSVALELEASGRCRAVRIGLGGVGLVPLRVPTAEKLLTGQELSGSLLAEAAEAVANCTESYADARGPEDYRRHLGGVMFRRALEVARWRASGEAGGERGR